MIKALFFDLDGTLLTPSRKMSEKTKIAPKTCKEMGIKVFAATDRCCLLECSTLLPMRRKSSRIVVSSIIEVD